MSKKEQVESFYDSIAKDYDVTHDDRFVDAVFEHFLKEYISGSNLNILDAGGGVGRFSINYAIEGHNVVLTDISQGMVDTAKLVADNHNLKNITFFQESVTDMKNQKDGAFDVVLLMNGVLDYCSDYSKALNEVFRVLRKGGTVIGTVNNKFVYTTTNILLADKDTTAFRQAFKTGNYLKSFPIHDFSVEELREAFKQSSFGIVDIVGPTNLLRKWEYNSILTKDNRAKLLVLQIEFARNKDYLNNSTDFLFIAKKL